jgi:REP element-mobilizing transposase RayT
MTLGSESNNQRAKHALSFFRIERPDIRKRYSNNVLWSPSYFAGSCGGAPLGVIKQYVANTGLISPA